MTMLTDEDIGSGTLRFAKDYVGVDYHNDSHSHIDALCHVAFDGALYNGRESESVTAEGASGRDNRGPQRRTRGARLSCSTSPASVAWNGSSRASTSFQTTWTRPSDAQGVSVG